jgi:hypothetical protein
LAIYTGARSGELNRVTPPRMQVVGTSAGIFRDKPMSLFFEYWGEMVDIYTIYERSENDSKVMNK